MDNKLVGVVGSRNIDTYGLEFTKKIAHKIVNENILGKYSTRLVNISGRNRSLVMKKIYKKRAFDIMRLSEFNEKIGEELIKLISSRSTKELKILEDPIEWYNNELNKLKKEHLQERGIFLDRDI